MAATRLDKYLAQSGERSRSEVFVQTGRSHYAASFLAADLRSHTA